MKKTVVGFKIVAVIILYMLCSCGRISQVGKKTSMELWYIEPAKEWVEALPVGNGRLGAMVYGKTAHEQIQLNEETVWSGGPGNNIDPELGKHIPEIRKLVFDGKYSEAQELATKYIPVQPAKNNNYGMCYQPVGDLWIDFPGHEQVEDYRRALDMEKAATTVTYRKNGIRFTRELFASFTDDVLIMHLSADKPGSITCRLSADSPHETYSVFVEDNQLILGGITGDVENKKGKVIFSTHIKPRIDGGSISTTGRALQINNADAVTLYISIGTNFKNYNDLSGDGDKKASELLNRAFRKDFHAARAAHIKKYQQFFNRVNLDLGSTDSVKNPTDVRLAQFNSGNDPQLIALYFQFGRYLLISSSQPGTQPANLQGIWNDKIYPPWDSKYTVNINTEMNYWPAEVTNLSELHEPLFDMLSDLSVTGKESASVIYHAQGWNVHHNTDLWRISGPVDEAYYSLWPMGGAWLTQHIWQHYLYTGDLSFLKQYYPVLKEVAVFYTDILRREPEHNWLVVCPSISPENEHQNKVSIAAGTTMDNQLVYDVFSNVIAADSILNIDALFSDSLKLLIAQLPPMQIGRWGQLQEWMYDWDRQEDTHRHVSHLYGLYPSNQISPYRTPELFMAAKTSLLARGDVSTGWSMGWKVNLWARLLDGDHALKLIRDQIRPSRQPDNSERGGTYPNLFDAHPPFQIDGNFGCSAGIAEMLLQSHDGAIHILPALPAAWDKGKITGLRARGGFTIDIAWNEGRPDTIAITSSLGGNCRIRTFYLLEGKGLRRATGKNPNPFFGVPGIRKPLVSDNSKIKAFAPGKIYEYDLSTQSGGRYILHELRQ